MRGDFIKKVLSVFAVMLICVSVFTLTVSASYVLPLSAMPSDYPSSLPSVYSNFTQYVYFKAPAGSYSVSGKYCILTVSTQSYCYYDNNDSSFTIHNGGWRIYYWSGSAWVQDEGIAYSSGSNSTMSLSKFSAFYNNSTCNISGLYTYTPSTWDYRNDATSSQKALAPTFSVSECPFSQYPYYCVFYDKSLSCYSVLLSYSKLYSEDSSASTGLYSLAGAWTKVNYNSSSGKWEV